MLHFVLRALLLFSLFCGAMPTDASHKYTEHAIDAAPSTVLPAGEPRRQVKVEVPNLVVARPPALRVHSPFERAVEPRPQPFRLCAHPPASRTHLTRRRIPRMRDDLGDH